MEINKRAQLPCVISCTAGVGRELGSQEKHWEIHGLSPLTCCAAEVAASIFAIYYLHLYQTRRGIRLDSAIIKSNHKLPLTSGRAEASALPGHSATTCSLDKARAGALLGKADNKDEHST